LDNITSIDGILRIYNNYALTSLTGLDNINASSINRLTIEENYLLSYCNLQNICDYLVSPNGTIEIYENAYGCNSQEEVEEACETVSIEDLLKENMFSISPNPCKGTASLKISNIEQGMMICDLYSIEGFKIMRLLNKEVMAGEHEIEVDLSELPAGVYVCVLKTSDRTEICKLIKL